MLAERLSHAACAVPAACDVVVSCRRRAGHACEQEGQGRRNKNSGAMGPGERVVMAKIPSLHRHLREGAVRDTGSVLGDAVLSAQVPQDGPTGR